MKLNPWVLDSHAEYLIENDSEVKLLMLQLGVPDLFAGIRSTSKPQHTFVAFDNHPTHWIVLSLWQGAPEYSPNHGIHKFAAGASANGLLFRAAPKIEVTKAKFLAELREMAVDATAPSLSQLPAHGAS